MDSQDSNKIPLSIESPIPIEPSSDLIESMEESTFSEKTEGDVYTKAEDAITKFKGIEDAYTTAVVEKASEAMFPSVEFREEYYKKIASALYREIYKQSKLFLKEWQFLNLQKPIWTNPYARFVSMRNLSHLSKFMPKVYNISMRNIDSGEITPIVEMMPTPEEATIAAAKKLGFDSSNYRRIAFAKFSKQSVEVILKDDRYLKEERYLAIFEEHRKQIEKREYVSSALKENWLRTLQNNCDQRNDLI